MVKDEADVVAATVGHMLTQVDEVLVLDNGSTDGTRDILADLGVKVYDDPDPAYYQSVKMSRLAATAHDQGASWVVPFDADEWWWSPWGTVAEVLRAHEDTYGIVQAVLFDFMATGFDPPEEQVPDPTVRLQWRRRDELELSKVACRVAPGLVIEQGNHWARHRVPARFTEERPLAVRHYPYRSVGQFIRKVRNGAAAYAATEGLPEEMGGHWRQWGRFDDEQLADVFHTWYYRATPNEDAVVGGEVLPALVKDPLRR
jgi:glycosyltransferase involved in cell wall biosynthesis